MVFPDYLFLNTKWQHSTGSNYLEHEREVNIPGPIADVDVSMLRCHRDMVEGQTKPQMTADHTHLVGTFKTQVP